MNSTISSSINIFLLAAFSLFIAACGGAPGSDGDNSSGGGSGNVVNIQDVPTLLSLSIQEVAGPLDFDGIEVSMTATAGGLLGNPITRDLTVEFVSPEMGVFMQDSCVIQANSESCSVTWVSAGVRPENREVSIVIIASGGAEQFADLNGNELYDQNEPIEIDYPEPFADENDNGFIDPGEFFADVNGNGVFDLGNGEWNGPCEFTTLDCSGANEAVLFDLGNLTLCPMEVPEGEDPLPGCEEINN